MDRLVLTGTGVHLWYCHRKQTEMGDVVVMRACSDVAICLLHLDLASLSQTTLETLGLGKFGLKMQLAVDLYYKSCAGTYMHTNGYWLAVQTAHTG